MTPIRNSRRTFLKSAGMTALVGAVTGSSSRATARGALWEAPADELFDFETPYSRVGTHCIKWDRQIEKFGKDNIMVGMGIADMDFPAAPCITRALAERCHHENWGYLEIPDSYIESIVAWNKKRYGLDIDPDTIVLSNGVHPALIAALHTFSPPGSKVLLTTPTYNGFYSDLTYCNVQPEDSPMKLVNGRYSIDFDDLESRISHDTHTLILCNPQNPTGNCWSAEDLMKLGELCLKRRVVVLADEIHCDFVNKGEKYTPFASLPDKEIVDNSLTFKAASKTFSLAAMKSAWFFSTNPDYLARVKANHRADVNTLGLVANQAALTEGESWLDQLLVYIDGNHAFVENYIKDNMPLVQYTKAEGTYLAWLDVGQVIDRIDAKKKAAEASKTADTPVTPTTIVEKWFVENAKVQLNPGASYGTGGEDHMRMNLGTSRKLIELALDNMAAALKNV
ncbi:MAG TPA: aminotransferase class I/II-fold pyridoxal phosphate-dependent enzyme [Vicinamibacteria bacterium]|nr:aminotransferase class I/II-fold pyridoxal phosphate-dependent enzyme [Vicinamibacteria bacterium]